MLLLYKVRNFRHTHGETCGEKYKKEKRKNVCDVCLYVYFLCIAERVKNGKWQHGIFIKIGINVHIHDGMLFKYNTVWSMFLQYGKHCFIMLRIF